MKEMENQEHNVGVWIDYEKAVLVRFVGKKRSVMRVESGVPGHFRLLKNSRSKPSSDFQDLSPQKRIEERYKNQLHKYYKKIIYETDDADHIFIFGPNEARLELKKEMKKSKARGERIAGVERAGQMTESQIVAKVKQFYS